ncbi:hypothetical protein PG987_006674 [Apiospora arundinis]
MSGSLRSKQGCWTCRLRKKKCDEGRPQCSTCEALSIMCYGYGPKPEWMSDEAQTKTVADGIKQIVKITSRRRNNIARDPAGPTVKLAPKPSHGSVDTPITDGATSSPDDGVEKPEDDRGSSLEVTGEARHGAAQDSISSQGTPQSSDGDRHQATINQELLISDDEPILLMHFLDTVFPLQYPMYDPDIIEGGRGWLLSLLLRTKPLYHAALAVSSYHRRIRVIHKLLEVCRAAARDQQERHLELSLRAVREAITHVNEFVHRRQSTNQLGTVASIVELVFFELLAGEGHIWKIHLDAAIEMYHRSCVDQLAHLDLTEKSRRILLEDLAVYEELDHQGATVTQEVATFRFMSGSIIWLDILASITLGAKPKLLAYHASVITPQSQIRLESIMGCKNWVMTQIGQIAALHARKERAPETHTATIALDIGHALQLGISQEEMHDLSLSTDYAPRPSVAKASDIITLVTVIYASVAQIYLHLVVHGYQGLEVLNPVMSKLFQILRAQTPRHVFPALVCPFFILGCAARPGEEQRWIRDIMASQEPQDRLFRHRCKISPVLEKVWILREMNTDFRWKDTLNLCEDLLLY